MMERPIRRRAAAEIRVLSGGAVKEAVSAEAHRIVEHGGLARPAAGRSSAGPGRPPIPPEEETRWQ
jgi:hypothetical protein